MDINEMQAALRAAREAKFPKGVPMTIDEVAAVVGDEFKEMNENPPDSVVKVRERMQGKSAAADGRALLDFMSNGIEHNDRSQAIRHMGTLGVDPKAAGALYDGWAKMPKGGGILALDRRIHDLIVKHVPSLRGKVALSEQEITDELEYLAGGHQKAHRLMKIWGAVQNLGTHYDQMMNPERYDPVRNFITRARRERYSDEAIRWYVEEVQGHDWPRGRVAGDFYPKLQQLRDGTFDVSVAHIRALNGRREWRLFAAVPGAVYPRGRPRGSWFYPPGLEPGTTGFASEREAMAYLRRHGIPVHDGSNPEPGERRMTARTPDRGGRGWTMKQNPHRFLWDDREHDWQFMVKAIDAGWHLIIKDHNHDFWRYKRVLSNHEHGFAMAAMMHEQMVDLGRDEWASRMERTFRKLASREPVLHIVVKSGPSDAAQGAEEVQRLLGSRYQVGSRSTVGDVQVIWVRPPTGGASELFHRDARRVLQLLQQGGYGPDMRRSQHLNRDFAQAVSRGKTAARASSGLYGYPKKITADCEVSIRRLQKVANKIAARVLQQDARVPMFLRVHAKRAGSRPARILVAAMEAMEAAQAPETTVEVETPKEAGKARYGLYGFRSKTSERGMRACMELRVAAGMIAGELHSRRQAEHDRITGWYAAHNKRKRCNFARVLLHAYPDENMRCASEAPTTVAGWLSWED